MEYKEVTTTIITQCRIASVLLHFLGQTNDKIHQDSTQTEQAINHAIIEVKKWAVNSIDILETYGLVLEVEGFKNIKGSVLAKNGWNAKLSNLYFYLIDRKAYLLKIAKELENKKSEKVLVNLTIDDIDNFSNVRTINFNEVKDCANSAFLEDDIEECFLEAVGEPYKEADSGSETRDLFTNKIIVNGKRLATAIMFKGRGLSGTLSLDKCGSKGNQLLKLAKNNAAECFIVQHVNKIEPDVKETLIDLVLTNTRFNKVYICFIDGTDTVRLLKSMGKDIEKLKSKMNK
jgi:hypothetical protein